jgi:hypothetical protein
MPLGRLGWRDALGRLEVAWQWIKDNDRALLVCFAFVGGIYALFEYWGHVKTEREQEVARFVELQGSPHIMAARVALDSFMNTPEVQALNAGTYDSYVAKQITNQPLVTAILTQLNFFDALYLCVEGHQCSRDLACRYFLRIRRHLSKTQGLC